MSKQHPAPAASPHGEVKGKGGNGKHYQASQDPAAPQFQDPIQEQEDLLAVVPEEPAVRRRNPFRPSGFGGRVFDFLASLRLAVLLLTTMGLVCIAGTIYESSYTARLAQRLVYRTPWFDFLIVMIFLNVLFATLARFPWRLIKTGFVITHLGVMTLLFGALVSHRYGVEGQMMLNEGETRDRIQLSTSFIGIQKIGDPIRHRFDAVEVEWGHPSPEKPQVYDFKDLGLKAIVTGFLPDSEWVEAWKDNGPEENPAIHFAIENSGMGQMAEGWLAPNMPSSQSMNLGPASITAREMLDQAHLEHELSAVPSPATSELGFLQIKVKKDGRIQQIDVQQAMKAPVVIENTSCSIKVLEQMNAAYLNESGVLVNDPSRPSNPLVIYEVYQNNERILPREIEYANFPDFGMMHAQGEVESPVEATYIPGKNAKSSNAEFALLIGPADQLHWKVTTSAGEASSGPIALGKAIPMPMMTAGMSLVVDQFYKRAWREENLVQKPIKKGEFGTRAARLELQDQNGNQAQVWAEMYSPREVVLGGNRYQIRYQNDEQPLGFAIQLKDFRLRHYPGGEVRPMSYESDVKVISQAENGESLVRDNITIQMNEPLDHGGFRIFQSSYIDQPRGDPRISIFSIAHDPGVNIIYLGSIILCVGIVIMFYGKPYMKKLESRRAQRKVEVGV